MPRPRNFRKFIGNAVLCALSLFVLACAWISIDGFLARPVKADFAVVLGNKVNPDRTPSRRLAARLQQAEKLWRSGEVKDIVVSGGVSPQGISEAEVMRAYLISRGVSPEKIFTDPAGVTTAASANNVKALADQKGWKSVVIVSQYFHLARARLAFGRSGFESISSSAPRYFEFRDFYSIPREALGFVVYWWTLPKMK